MAGQSDNRGFAAVVAAVSDLRAVTEGLGKRQLGVGKQRYSALLDQQTETQKLREEVVRQREENKQQAATLKAALEAERKYKAERPNDPFAQGLLSWYSRKENQPSFELQATVKADKQQAAIAGQETSKGFNEGLTKDSPGKQFGDKFLSDLRESLQISSPSKKGKELGSFFVEGWLQPFKSLEVETGRSVERAVKNAQKSLENASKLQATFTVQTSGQVDEWGQNINNELVKLNQSVTDFNRQVTSATFPLRQFSWKMESFFRQFKPAPTPKEVAQEDFKKGLVNVSVDTKGLALAIQASLREQTIDLVKAIEDSRPDEEGFNPLVIAGRAFSSVANLVMAPIEATLFGAFERFGGSFTKDLGEGLASQAQKSMGLDWGEVGQDLGEILGNYLYRIVDESSAAVRNIQLDNKSNPLIHIEKAVGTLIDDLFKAIGTQIPIAGAKAYRRIRINKEAIPQLKRMAGRAIIEEDIPDYQRQEIDQSRSITLAVGGYNQDADDFGKDYTAQLLKPLLGKSAVIPVQRKDLSKGLDPIFERQLNNILEGSLEDPKMRQSMIDMVRQSDFFTNLSGPEKREFFGDEGLDLTSNEVILKTIKSLLSSEEFSIGKVIEQVFRGYGLDDLVVASQALKYRQQFPDKPINIVGFSQGGMQAAGATELLQRMGVKNVKGVGIGTTFSGPEYSGNRDDFMSFVGEEDYYFKAFSGLLEAMGGSPDYVKSAEKEGVLHSLVSYVAGPAFKAELQSFLGDRVDVAKDSEYSRHDAKALFDASKDGAMLSVLRSTLNVLGVEDFEGVSTDRYSFSSADLTSNPKTYVGDIVKALKRVKNPEVKAFLEKYVAFLGDLRVELERAEVSKSIGEAYVPDGLLEKAQAIFPQLESIPRDKTPDVAKVRATRQKREKADQVISEQPLVKDFVAKLNSERANIQRSFLQMMGMEIPKDVYAYFDPKEYETRAKEHLGGFIGWLEGDDWWGKASDAEKAVMAPYIEFLKEFQADILRAGKEGKFNRRTVEKARDLLGVRLPAELEAAVKSSGGEVDVRSKSFKSVIAKQKGESGKLENYPEFIAYVEMLNREIEAYNKENPKNIRPLLDPKTAKYLGSGHAAHAFYQPTKDGGTVYKASRAQNSEITRPFENLAKSLGLGGFGIANPDELKAMAAASNAGGAKLRSSGDRFIEMEYFEGSDLRKALDGANPETIKETLYQVGQLLKSLHDAGVTHGDFHLANIMQTSEGLRAIDFGLAKKTKDPKRRQADLDKISENAKWFVKNFAKGVSDSDVSYMLSMGYSGTPLVGNNSAVEQEEEQGNIAVRYRRYLDDLVSQARKNAESTISALIPNLKNLNIEQQRDAVKSYTDQTFKERLRAWREAIAAKNLELAQSLGEGLLNDAESMKVAYEQIESESSGTNVANRVPRYKAELTKIQTEITQGQPNLTGRSPIGLEQLIAEAEGSTDNNTQTFLGRLRQRITGENGENFEALKIGLDFEQADVQVREFVSRTRNAIEQSLSDLLDPIRQLHKSRRETELPNALAEAERLAAQQTVQATGTKPAIFAVGGLMGKKGKGGQYWQKHLDALGITDLADVQYVDYENTDSHVPLNNPLGFVASGVGNVIRNHRAGSNPDAVRLAAQVIALRKSQPDTPINLLGHSAGADVVQEAIAILEKGGYQGIKGVGVAGVDYGAQLPTRNYRNLPGEHDVVLNALGFIGTQRSQKEFGQMTNTLRHGIGGYRRHPEFIKQLDTSLQAMAGLKALESYLQEFRTATGSELQAVLTDVKRFTQEFAEVFTLDAEGKNAIDSLLTAVEAELGRVKAVWAEVGDSAKEGIDTALDMHSPSKEMRDRGENAGSSFVDGLESTISDARSVVSEQMEGVLKELKKEALKYKNADDFLRSDWQKKVVAGQELAEETGAKVNYDGTVSLYHGTSKQNAEKITQGGRFNEGSYFSVKKSGTQYGDSPLDVAKRKFGKDATVLEVRVDARGLESAAAGSEIFAPNQLVKQEDGSWASSEIKSRSELKAIWEESVLHGKDAGKETGSSFANGLEAKISEARSVVSEQMEGVLKELKAAIEQDLEYLRAVSSGDVVKAQKMVEQAAKKSGYNVGPVYHGTNTTKYIPGQFVAGDPSAHSELNKLALRLGLTTDGAVSVLERWERFGQLEEMGATKEDVARAKQLKELSKARQEKGKDLIGFNEFKLPGGKTELGSHFGNESAAAMFGSVFPFFLKLSNPVRMADLGDWNARDVLSSLGLDKKYKQGMGAKALRTVLTKQKFDGVIYENKAEGFGDSFIAIDPKQIKSADALTKTDKGQVVPLSQRFDENVADIRGNVNIKSVRDYVKSLLPEVADNLIDSLTKAVESQLSELKEAGAAIGDALKEGTEESLKIESPSKVYKAIGEQIIKGLEGGLDGFEGTLEEKRALLDTYVKSVIELVYDFPKVIGKPTTEIQRIRKLFQDIGATGQASQKQLEQAAKYFPQLEKMPEGKAGVAVYQPKKNIIQVNPDREGLPEDLMHEYTHAVQNRFGLGSRFAQTPSDFFRYLKVISRRGQVAVNDPRIARGADRSADAAVQGYGITPEQGARYSIHYNHMVRAETEAYANELGVGRERKRRGFFKADAEEIAAKIKAERQAAKEAAKQAKEAIAEPITEIKQAVTEQITEIKEAIAEQVQPVREASQEVAEAIGKGLEKGKEHSQDILKNVLDWIEDIPIIGLVVKLGRGLLGAIASLFTPKNKPPVAEPTAKQKQTVSQPVTPVEKLPDTNETVLVTAPPQAPPRKRGGERLEQIQAAQDILRRRELELVNEQLVEEAKAQKEAEQRALEQLSESEKLRNKYIVYLSEMVAKAEEGATRQLSSISPEQQGIVSEKLTETATKTVEKYRQAIAESNLTMAQQLGEKALRQTAIAEKVNRSLKNLGVRDEVGRDNRLAELTQLKREITEGIPGTAGRASVGLVSLLNMPEQTIQSVSQSLQKRIGDRELPNEFKTRQAAGAIGAGDYQQSLVSTPPKPKPIEVKELNPQRLADQYVTYLSQWASNLGSEFDKAVKLKIQQWKESGANVAQSLRAEIDQAFEGFEERKTEFRQAIADGQNELAKALGVDLVEQSEKLRVLYQNMTKNVRAFEPGGGPNFWRDQSAEMTKVQREAMKGYPNLKGRAKTGTYQAIAGSQSDEFLQTVEGEIKKAEKAGFDLGEAKIRGVKKALKLGGKEFSAYSMGDTEKFYMKISDNLAIGYSVSDGKIQNVERLDTKSPEFNRKDWQNIEDYADLINQLPKTKIQSVVGFSGSNMEWLKKRAEAVENSYIMSGIKVGQNHFEHYQALGGETILTPEELAILSKAKAKPVQPVQSSPKTEVKPVKKPKPITKEQEAEVKQEQMLNQAMAEVASKPQPAPVAVTQELEEQVHQAVRTVQEAQKEVTELTQEQPVQDWIGALLDPDKTESEIENIRQVLDDSLGSVIDTVNDWLNFFEGETSSLTDIFADGLAKVTDAFQQLEQNFPIFNRLKELLGRGGILAGQFFAAFAVGSFLAQATGLDLFVDAIASMADPTLQAAVNLEIFKTTMRAVSPDSNTAAKNIQFLDSTVQALGANLEVARSAYAGFKAVTQYGGLSGERGDRLFKTFAKVTTDRGLTQEEQQQTFTALQQILSKGKLTSEEVVQQLGEIPALDFRNTLARALGINAAQLTEALGSGQLMAEDVIPKVAAQYEAEANSIGESSDNAQKSLNRFNNAALKLKESFQGEFLPARKTGLSVLGQLLEWLQPIVKNVDELFRNFALMMFGRFVVSIASGRLAIEGLKTGLIATWNVLKAFLPTLGKLLGQMVLVQLAVDAWGAAIDTFKNRHQDIVDGNLKAAKSAEAFAAAIRDLTKASKDYKPPELPKNADEIINNETWKVFGRDTKTNLEKGDIWRNMVVPFPLRELGNRLLPDALKKQLEKVDSPRELFGRLSNAGRRAVGLPEGVVTQGQKNLNDYIEAVSQLSLEANQTISTRDAEARRRVAEMLDLDRKLNASRSRQMLNMPGDKNAYDLSKKEQEKLLSQREELTKAIAAQQQSLEDNIATTKLSLARLQEMASGPNPQITQDEYVKQKEILNQTLSGLTKTKNSFEELTSTIVKQVNALERAVRNLNEQAQAFKENLERTTQLAQARIYRQALTSGEGSQVVSLRAEQGGLSQQRQLLDSNQSQISQLYQYLQNPEFAPVYARLQQQMAEQGLTLESSATLQRLLEERGNLGDGGVEKSVITTLQQIVTLKNEVASQENQVAQAIYQGRQTLLDLTKSVEEYFIGLQDQIKQAQIELNRQITELRYRRLKGLFANVLVPGVDGFVAGLVSTVQKFIDDAAAIANQEFSNQSSALQFETERSQLNDGLRDFTRNLGGANEAIKNFAGYLSKASGGKVKGFATGGYTGDVPTNQVAGVVHGKEFVMNAEATQRLGPQFLAQLQKGTDLRSLRNNPMVMAFLDVIAFAEGAGYNTLFGGGKFKSFADHPNQRIKKGRYTSSASGRYQIMDFNWFGPKGLKTQLGLPDFSPESQDIAAIALLKRRGALDAVLAGDFDRAIRLTNKEWASLPGSPYGQPTKSFNTLWAKYQQSLISRKAQQAIAPIDNTVQTPVNQDGQKLINQLIGIKGQQQKVNQDNLNQQLKENKASADAAIAEQTYAVEQELKQADQENRNFNRQLRDFREQYSPTTAAIANERNIRNTLEQLQDQARAIDEYRVVLNRRIDSLRKAIPNMEKLISELKKSDKPQDIQKADSAQKALDLAKTALSELEIRRDALQPMAAQLVEAQNQAITFLNEQYQIKLAEEMRQFKIKEQSELAQMFNTQYFLKFDTATARMPISAAKEMRDFERQRIQETLDDAQKFVDLQTERNNLEFEYAQAQREPGRSDAVILAEIALNNKKVQGLKDEIALRKELNAETEIDSKLRARLVEFGQKSELANTRLRRSQLEANKLTNEGRKSEGDDVARAAEIAVRRAELANTIANLESQYARNPELRDSLIADERAIAALDIEAINKKYKSLRETLLDLGRSGLGDFFENVFSGTKSVSDAFNDMAKNILSTVASLMSQLATVELFKMIGLSPEGLKGTQIQGIGTLFGGLGSLFGFAEGGYTGDGGKWEPKGIVHGGEFVMTQWATRQVGIDLLAAINKTGRVPVMAVPPSAGPSMAPPPAPSKTVIINQTFANNRDRYLTQNRTLLQDAVSRAMK